MSRVSRSAQPAITDEVTSWDGVESGYGKRGEFGFHVNGHEVGHLHGDHAAHFSFGNEIGTALKEQGASSTIRSSRARRVRPPGGSRPTRTSAR